MGKNRKAKQLVDQAEIHSEDDGCYNRNDEEVPVDFLTSDDFQVVQKKRHQPNKKSDETTYNGCCIPRSRSHSERFPDQEDIFGCHAGFWTIRNHETAALAESKDTAKIPTSKKKGALLKLKSEGDLSVRISESDSSGHGFVGAKTIYGSDNSNPSFEVEQVCQNKREENVKKVPNAKNILNVTCNYATHEESFQDFEEIERRRNIEEVKEFYKKLECDENILSSGSVKDDISCPKQNSSVENNIENVPGLTTKANSFLAENIGSGDHNSTAVVSLSNHANDDKSTDGMQSNSSASEGTMLKTSSQKKKNKKTRSKQTILGAEESGTIKPLPQMREHNGLANSSSSDFSELSNVEKAKKAVENVKKEDCGKRDRKRPSKKQLEAIHEALRKAKEEEERLKKEEEAKRKLAEEAAKLALEKLRLEQEKLILCYKYFPCYY